MFNQFHRKTVLFYLLSLLFLVMPACSEHEHSGNTEEAVVHGEETIADEVSTAEMTTWNKYCPIRGGEVSAEIPTVVYDDKVIGFCCPGCDEKFMKDPENLVKNLSEDGTKFIGG